MATVIRLLRTFIGSLLAVVALLVTTVAIVMLVTMAMVWWQDGHLAAHERLTLRWSALATIAGAICAWAGIRLAYGKRQAGETRTASFQLVRTKTGRQERFVEAFSVYVLFTVLAVELWYRVPGDPSRRVRQVAGWLAVTYLGIHLRVLLHELGHLGAGRVLGLQPWTLRVGMGPALWQGQTRAGFQWEWRLRPGAGWAECLYSSEKAFRRERFGVVLGGPVSDALLVTVGWLAWTYFGQSPLLPPTLPSAGTIVMDLMMFVTVASMAAGLVPHRVFAGDRLLHTDGWWLLKAFSLPAEKIKGWMFGQGYIRVQRLWKAGQQAAALAVVEALRGRHPEHAGTLLAFQGYMLREQDEPLRAAACFRQASEDVAITAESRLQLQTDCAAALATAGDTDGTRAWCAEVLARPASPEEHVKLLDAFACLPLLFQGTRALLPDAQSWCKEALALAPDQLTVQGTHGALLVELDRCEEAWPILQTVFAGTASERDRGICAVYLALAAQRLGRADEMHKYRVHALRCCDVPALTKRITAEIPVV